MRVTGLAVFHANTFPLSGTIAKAVPLNHSRDVADERICFGSETPSLTFGYGMQLLTSKETSLTSWLLNTLDDLMIVMIIMFKKKMLSVLV